MWRLASPSLQPAFPEEKGWASLCSQFIPHVPHVDTALQAFECPSSVLACSLRLVSRLRVTFAKLQRHPSPTSLRSSALPSTLSLSAFRPYSCSPQGTRSFLMSSCSFPLSAASSAPASPVSFPLPPPYSFSVGLSSFHLQRNLPEFYIPFTTTLSLYSFTAEILKELCTPAPHLLTSHELLSPC